MSEKVEMCLYLEMVEIRKLLQTLIERRERKRKEKERNKFKPPTVVEVSRYCVEQNYSLDVIDPDEFVNFYESKGWLVGKVKMKNWQSAVRNWVKRSEDKKPKPDEPVIDKAQQELINKADEATRRAFEESMGIRI